VDFIVLIFRLIFQSCQNMPSLNDIINAKGGVIAYMDKLSVTERRLKILEYLIINKKTTRYDLSREFCVSVYTIGRDVIYLSTIAPIYTLQGNGGGICILPEYNNHRIFLSETEEDFLYSLIEFVNEEDKEIIYGIITKFSMKHMFDV